ncbi:hypothetical protein [Caulobacter sp. UNC279MFTsu5.1]|uniref:hypothetical protein n=1 Tax=Caulobacter sp. UNC279MFTsu5.1 TaxID=1502775 RepID=UPI0003806EE7|nr:hypothetical protein [Caulobacter sp. UNC279MFTsu5.1]SFK41062.1 hypothetical protein SAMN02799626_04212 [Caulobacter sp. UNC279MFTsu5.1]
MPEPSASDRRKAAALKDEVASTLLIDCVELGHDVWFKCQYCGMERTWGRREMLGSKLRVRLAWPLDRIQRAVVCPIRGCGGPMPIIRLMQGGYQDGFDRADATRRRAWLIEALLDAGIMPADVGLAWTPAER